MADQTSRRVEGSSRTDDELREAKWGPALLWARLSGKPPPSLEEVLRDDARANIRSCESNFAGSGNPMHAIEAYRWARWVGDPIPEWALACLDRAFSALWTSYEIFYSDRLNGRKTKQNPARALVDAFGFNNGKGKDTVWENDFPYRASVFGSTVVRVAEEHSREGRIFNLSGLIEELLQVSPFESPKLSRTTAWHYWQKYADRFPDERAKLERLPGYRIQKQRARRPSARGRSDKTTPPNRDFAE